MNGCVQVHTCCAPLPVHRGPEGSAHLLGREQQLHCLLILSVFNEEPGAAGEQGWVGCLIQVLSNELQGPKLLRSKGQLQGFGEVSCLQN